MVKTSRIKYGDKENSQYKMHKYKTMIHKQIKEPIYKNKYIEVYRDPLIEGKKYYHAEYNRDYTIDVCKKEINDNGINIISNIRYYANLNELRFVGVYKKHIKTHWESKWSKGILHRAVFTNNGREKHIYYSNKGETCFIEESKLYEFMETLML